MDYYGCTATSAPFWRTLFGRCPELVSGLVRAARIAPLDPVSGLVFSPALRYQTAMNENSIEGLAKKLADSLPGGLRAMREDLEQNFRSVLKGGLQKLDLVTREEFEVQEAVLARTREKLEALEKQVAELEGSSD
jgi:BMFP domain-containing protein YqiC